MATYRMQKVHGRGSQVVLEVSRRWDILKHILCLPGSYRGMHDSYATKNRGQQKAGEELNL